MRIKAFLLLLGLELLTGRILLAAQDTNPAVPLTIVVMDSSGAVIPYAQIKLAPKPATNANYPETNEAGQATLKTLPGNYDLLVTAPDFVPWAKNIRVEAKANQTVTVTLQPAKTTQIIRVCSPCPLIQIGGPPEPPVAPVFPSASLTITVTDAAGAAVPYAQIGIDPEEITRKIHETDESGRVSIKLASGIYNVAVTSPGFRRWTKLLGLKEKENQTVKVVLEVGGCLPGPCAAVDSNR